MRGLKITPQQALIREMILQLKKGELDVGYFRNKFGVDILDEVARRLERVPRRRPAVVRCATRSRSRATACSASTACCRRSSSRRCKGCATHERRTRLHDGQVRRPSSRPIACTPRTTCGPSRATSTASPASLRLLGLRRAAAARRLLPGVDRSTPATPLREKQAIGEIESRRPKASCTLRSTGTLTEFNPELLKDPSPINVDTYGAGWLFHMDVRAGTAC